MRRADRRPAGSWIREAWINDEALRLTADLYERLTGAVHPLLVALTAGDSVQAWLWELPEIVGDRLRSEGYSPHQRFRLTVDDRLEPVR